MSEQNIKTSDALVHWAIVAAQAAGIPPAEVAIVDNYEDSDLPAVEIGDTRLWQARTSSDGDDLDGYGWKCTEWGEYYDTLREGLLETVAAEILRRVEIALAGASFEEVQP